MKVNFKKVLKRTFIGIGIFLVLLLGAIVAIPYFFKDELVAFTKNRINENINAKVDFKDVALSLFWTFPNFGLTLKDLSVEGKDEFAGLKLADIKGLTMELDFWSVYNMASQPIQINSFELEEPSIYVKVLPDGKANYNITKPSEEKSSGGEFKMKLSEYAIKNGHIVYDDQAQKVFVELKGLNHSGSGDFNNTIYDIDTETEATNFTVYYGSIPYINNTTLGADITVNADMGKSKFTMKENSVRLNDLTLNFDGYVAMPENGMDMDMKFNAPKATFASVLSMIPAAYTKDFSSVKTNGTASLNGFVKGQMTETVLPAFALNLNVDKAYFKYPTLPMAVEDINAKINVSSPQSSSMDDLVVDISKFHIKLGKNPFDATLNVRTPISDPQIKSKVDGIINLEDLAKAYPLDGVKALSGIIKAKLDLDTRMSYVEKEEYAKVNLKGDLDITNMNYQGVGMPKVLIKNLKTEFTPNSVNLYNFDANLGKSDMKASGKLDNILTYFSRDKVMKGNLTVRSNYFDANEWMGGDESSSKTTATDSKMAQQKAAANKVEENSADTPFDKFDFTGDLEINKLLYGSYELNLFKAKGHFTPEKLDLERFETKIGASDIAFSGKLENWWDYLYKNQTITGDIKVNSKLMDLNQFMTAEADPKQAKPATTTQPSEATEPILVPKNMKIDIDGNFDKLIYTTYELTNLNGHIKVADQKASLVGMKANTMGGAVGLNGFYETTDSQKPKFKIDFDLRKFGFKDIAAKVASVKAFAPIMEQIDGFFNSSFGAEGFLKPDLMPELNSLTANGLLETMNASMKGINFKPLQGLSSQLGLKDLENFNLENTKNFFEIKNGMFEWKPTSLKIGKDISLVAEGKHGLASDMDYKLAFEVPREKLNKNAAGAAANNLLGQLTSQMSAKGLNVSPGDFIKFDVLVSGTMKDPKFKVKFLDLGKTASNIGDAIKQKAEEEANRLKKEAEDRLRSEADKLKTEAEAKVKAEADRLKKEAEDRLKAEADRLKKEAEEKLKGQVGDKAKEEIDKLKDKAGDIFKNNPFGGKKKN